LQQRSPQKSPRKSPRKKKPVVVIDDSTSSSDADTATAPFVSCVLVSESLFNVRLLYVRILCFLLFLDETEPSDKEIEWRW